MELKTIAPDLSVSALLEPDAIGRAANADFRSIVINRPGRKARRHASSA